MRGFNETARWELTRKGRFECENGDFDKEIGILGNKFNKK